MSSNEIKFKNLIKLAKNILVITGSGISAESGIPTYRGGFKWRNYDLTSLANLEAFRSNPSLVWEFYHYRREVCLNAHPNSGHLALSSFESNCKNVNKQFTLITQNIDGLHKRSGSENIISVHGELFETRCVKCGDVKDNFDSPICPALKDRGSEIVSDYPRIPIEDLPHCKKCKGLLRPNVVWFGESLDEYALERSYDLLGNCDLCMVIGTSAFVQPVASFPLEVVDRGIPVAEFNIEKTLISDQMSFFFEGPSGSTLPLLLN